MAFISHEQKSIINEFLSEEPLWFKLSYPYLWHPLKGMVHSATIFMIVAVSAERFRAVCHPLARRQVNSISAFQVMVIWETRSPIRFRKADWMTVLIYRILLPGS